MSIQIVLQPADYIAAVNDQVAYAISAYSSDETLSYLLQRREIGEDNWTDTTVTTTYWNTVATTTRIAREYRWKVTGSGGSVVLSRIFRMYNKSQTLTLQLQHNNSETITVDKNIDTVRTMPGYLRENCSIIDPVFMIEADLQQVAQCNYLTVDMFGRSYFINNIESVTTGLVAVSCHVDVLSSFADEIRANKGIVRRAESNSAFNLYINDNSLVAYQDPYILTEPFPNGFTGTAFILAVAGA